MRDNLDSTRGTQSHRARRGALTGGRSRCVSWLVSLLALGLGLGLQGCEPTQPPPRREISGGQTARLVSLTTELEQDLRDLRAEVRRSAEGDSALGKGPACCADGFGPCCSPADPPAEPRSTRARRELADSER